MPSTFPGVNIYACDSAPPGMTYMLCPYQSDDALDRLLRDGWVLHCAPATWGGSPAGYITFAHHTAFPFYMIFQQPA